MKTSPKFAGRVFDWMMINVVSQRAPDFIIGADHPDGPYLLRWYLTPWRRWRAQSDANPTRWNRCKAAIAIFLPNLYLHRFMRDDDDRALHDHPSFAISYILRGGYVEHTIADGGIHLRQTYREGELRYMGVTHAHRVELFDVIRLKSRCAGLSWMVANGCAPIAKATCWTLFVFGPTVRDWGFHCPDRGWVHWREFTAADKPGEVGRGCDA